MRLGGHHERTIEGLGDIAPAMAGVHRTAQSAHMTHGVPHSTMLCCYCT